MVKRCRQEFNLHGTCTPADSAAPRMSKVAVGQAISQGPLQDPRGPSTQAHMPSSLPVTPTPPTRAPASADIISTVNQSAAKSTFPSAARPIGQQKCRLDLPPNVASWNVRSLSSTSLQRIEECNKEAGIQAWLLQDWKPPGSIHSTLNFAQRRGRVIIQGFKTAIFIEDDDWRVVGEPDHSEFGTSVVVQHRLSPRPWRLVSLYLPATPEERSRLLVSAACCDLLLVDLHPELRDRTIFLGDFNMQESWIDGLNEQVRRTNANRWPELCALLHPLAPIFRLLHPDLRVYSFVRFTTATADYQHEVGRIITPESLSSANIQCKAATRIDHCFMDPSLLPVVADMFYRFEPSASDHAILVVQFTKPQECQQRRPISWWCLAKLAAQAAADDEIVPALTSTVPQEVNMDAWRHFMLRLKERLDCFAREVNSGNRSPYKEVDLVRRGRSLQNRELTSGTVHAFILEVLEYEKARRSLYPEERMDYFSLHPDTLVWPGKRRAKLDVPLRPEQIESFFSKLYAAQGSERSRSWEKKAMALLMHAKTQLDSASKDRLSRPFTMNEMRAALHDGHHGAAAGPSGLTKTILSKADDKFVEYASRILNMLGEPGDAMPTTAKGVLLYKDKPGNSRDQVSDYRPISILDTDVRWFHSVLSKRLSPVLSMVVPHNQRGFLEGRRITDNVITMLIVIEASRHGLLRAPAIVLSQDQRKAYDLVSRTWTEIALGVAGVPDRIITVWRRLVGDSKLVFTTSDGFSGPIEIARGLPQGAATSSQMFLIAYQPLLDAMEDTRSGVTISFGRSAKPVRISSISYADNSDFFIGSKQDLDNFHKYRAKYDDVTGSQLNEKESVYFLLSNGQEELPGWTEGVPYKKLGPDEEFRYLGRQLKPDGGYPASATSRLTASIQSCARVTRRQTNIFTTAVIIRSVGYAAVWHLFEGPLDLGRMREECRTATKTFFVDGRGRNFNSALVHHPKPLGGIGLVEFIHDVDARTMAGLIHAVVSQDPTLRQLTRAFLDWAVRSSCLGGPCGMLMNAVIGNNAGGGDYESYTKRCVQLLRCFGLSLQQEPAWASLQPGEVAALPFLHDSYAFAKELTATRHRGLRFIAELGFPSFADLIWFDDRAARPEATCFFKRQGARPPTFNEFVHRLHGAGQRKWQQFSDDKRRILRRAIEELGVAWKRGLVNSWPEALRQKLSEFFAANMRSLAPKLAGAWGNLQPLRDSVTTSFPWEILSLAGGLLPTFRVKQGVRFLATTGVLKPGCPDGLKISRPKGANLSADSAQVLRTAAEEDAWAQYEGGEGEGGAPAGASWRLLSDRQWLRIWKEVHLYVMPGQARQAWWLILHRRGPVFRRHDHGFAACRLCDSGDADPDHVFASCPRGFELWQAMGAVLRLLLPDKFGEGVELSPCAKERMTGFPSLTRKMRLTEKLRFRLWYLLCVEQFCNAIRACSPGTPEDGLKAMFSTARLTSGLVRDIIRWLAVSQTGDMVHNFQERWLEGNLVVKGRSLEISAEAQQLIQEVAPQPVGQDPGAQPVTAAQHPAGVVAQSDELAMEAPTAQQWTHSETRVGCPCCGEARSYIERQTGLCAICFVKRTGATPSNAVHRRALSRGKCKRCGARGTLEGSQQKWRKDGQCKCCKSKTGARFVDINTSLCRGCFEAHTGVHPDGARPIPRPCVRCPDTQGRNTQQRLIFNTSSSSLDTQAAPTRLPLTPGSAPPLPLRNTQSVLSRPDSAESIATTSRPRAPSPLPPASAAAPLTPQSLFATQQQNGARETREAAPTRRAKPKAKKERDAGQSQLTSFFQARRPDTNLG